MGLKPAVEGRSPVLTVCLPERLCSQVIAGKRDREALRETFLRACRLPRRLEAGRARAGRALHPNDQRPQPGLRLSIRVRTKPVILAMPTAMLTMVLTPSKNGTPAPLHK